MKNTKILIVEDEVLVAENIKRCLMKNGYTVSSVAATGNDAIKQAKGDKPDLVLMDIVLKGEMDGIEAAEQIHDQFDIPVIYLTAYSDKRTFKRAKITEPFGYITKPFDEKQLVLTMEMALYKHKLDKEKNKLIEELENEITEHKKTEEALRESETELSAVFKNTPLIMFLLDRDRRVRKVNFAFEKATGQSADEMIGLRGGEAFRCIHSLDDTRGCGFGPICNKCTIRNTVLDTFDTGSNHHKVEAKLTLIIGENQEERKLLVSTALIDISNNKLVLVCIEDITESKLVVEALQQAMDIVQNIQVGLHIYHLEDVNNDKTLMMVAANQAAEKLTGVSTKDIVGKTLDENFPGLRVKGIPQKYAEVVRSGKQIELADVYYGDERVIEGWFSVKAFSLPNNHIGAAFENITEQKKSEIALIESEEKYRRLFNEMLDGFALHEIICDEKGKPIDYLFLEVNPAFEKLTGLKAEDIINKTVRQVLPSIESYWIENYGKVALTGKPIHFENYSQELNRYYEVTSFSPKKGQFATIFVDITERKQLEEERIKTEKLESIGILAGGIAHDFNNILAVILGNVSLAKISLDDKNEVVELLTETEKASVRATKLTQQLLTFAKGGAPVKETTELKELIRETTQFSLRGSNIQYRTSISPDLWIAEVDKGQISQVIGNLVINAQQAMPEGGTINIKAENVNVTSEDNFPLKEGNYIKISIEDKGHGIPEEQLTKIFDPYFTTKQKGSGLGLATTYSIIKRHGGYITVESELGVGTTFHIYLPASSKQLERKEVVKEDTAVMTGKILVMDDEEIVRTFVTKILKTFGNKVEVASDGAKVIKLYKKAMDSGEPYDVVIMDLTIPGGMGGKEAIQKLLEIDPDVKAVVSSGYSNNPVISNCEKYGFKGFLPKPYKLAELREVLNIVLSN